MMNPSVMAISASTYLTSHSSMTTTMTTFDLGMITIGAHDLYVHGWCIMFLVGTILGQDVCILVDTCVTRNILDINFARLANLAEQRILTTILVGNDNKIAC